MGDGPVAEVPYVAALLWTVGAAIVVTMVLSIAAEATTPKDSRKKDERDREIERFGEYIGQSFAAIGGVSALIMAMAEVDHFWIANAIYLAFALSGLLASVAKVSAYRRGFQSW
jgi:cell division protein FtsW (lipid II flippase)